MRRAFQPDSQKSTAARASCTSLPSSHLLVVDAGICTASPLGELPLGSHSVGFNYLFIFPPCYVALCASKARHSSESVSWCLETSLLKIPFPGRASLPGTELHPYLFCLSFYLLYFFLPPFEDNGLLFWVPDVLC